MDLTLNDKLRKPENVLVSELDGELVLLSLSSETYFGLNEVGASMWSALTAAGTVNDAWVRLAAEFDADPERLKIDLLAIAQQLVEHELLVVEH